MLNYIVSTLTDIKKGLDVVVGAVVVDVVVVSDGQKLKQNENTKVTFITITAVILIKKHEAIMNGNRVAEWLARSTHDLLIADSRLTAATQ